MILDNAAMNLYTQGMPTFAEIIDVIETYSGDPWEKDEYAHEIDFREWYKNLQGMMWEMVIEIEKQKSCQ
jgi:hypothetical protein